MHDNFFELGGDSIRMIQVLARARENGIVLTPAQLFKMPTIRELAGSFLEQVSVERLTTPFSMISKEDRALISKDAVDAYPLAALQAQAVAARTYAVAHLGDHADGAGDDRGLRLGPAHAAQARRDEQAAFEIGFGS